MITFEAIRDMVLRGNNGDEPTVVTVHTEERIKRMRKGGGTVSIVTEPDDKIYRISFFSRRRLVYNKSVPFGYK